MWTYLTIFLSLGTVLGVFFRRLVLFFKKAPQTNKPVEEPKEEKPYKPRKIEETVLQELEELCAKGDRKMKAGDDAGAIQCYVQALALDEYHQETQHKLAMLYLQKQMYSAAAALFAQLGQATNDPVHYSHLGLALYQQADFPEALKAYQKAVDLDDSRAQRFISLAQVYRSMGKSNHALVAMNKAVLMEPENIEYLMLLADMYVDIELLEEAKHLFENVLALDPENKDAKAFLRKVVEMEKKLGF